MPFGFKNVIKPLAFGLDFGEIKVYIIKTVVEEFKMSPNSDTDSDSGPTIGDIEGNSDLSDFDPSTYGCKEITPAIEKMVEDNWQDCDPLEGVYGSTVATQIKDIVKKAKESNDDANCAGINFYNDVCNTKDSSLFHTCTAVSYWCCCNVINKVSPIIADATIGLKYFS